MHETPALVGCSHEAEEPDGRAVVAGILDGVRHARPGLDVREAFVDAQEEMTDVVRAVIAEVGTAVLVPLLMSVEHRAHVDVDAAADLPGAAAAAALGPDVRLAGLLVDRLRDTGAGLGDAVVLAAAGSGEDRAVADVETMVDVLRSAWPHGPVTVGHVRARPSVREAVADARAAGAPRVVVAAYVLAPGSSHSRLLDAGADVVTPPLAPDARLVDIVLDRYDAAAAVLVARRDTSLWP
jgi:sirohydrochlorin ferrochelatase